MKKIAILIPCYNEALTIAKVVNDYRAVLPEADIYVYDNNSTDDTAKIAQHGGGRLCVMNIVKEKGTLSVLCFVISMRIVI